MPEKILIVDDDIETLRLVGLMLQRQGYEIASASNGAQAISMAQKDIPDLIVLDVMMPDMDGYQVTHTLRQMPDTALTPILMFTAKSQVDDKVAGYDAGVDDYLTKPVHPAELIAHIKALLSRTRARPVVSTPVGEKGHLVGVLACRGGLGTSTLTLNLATSYAQLKKASVIAVELRPGQGTWAMELGFNNQNGLSNILQHNTSEITQTLVENSLVNTSFGIKALLAPSNASNLDFATLSEKLVAITKVFSKISGVVFLDIGTSFIPGFENICQNLDEIIILTEPQLVTVKRTMILINQLHTANLMASKAVDLVLYNRVRSDMQMSSMQVTEELEGMPVSVLIPPVPELANQASQQHLPMINIQLNGLVTQQFNRLAEIIHDHVPS